MLFFQAKSCRMADIAPSIPENHLRFWIDIRNFHQQDFPGFDKIR